MEALRKTFRRSPKSTTSFDLLVPSTLIISSFTFNDFFFVYYDVTRVSLFHSRTLFVDTTSHHVCNFCIYVRSRGANISFFLTVFLLWSTVSYSDTARRQTPLFVSHNPSFTCISECLHSSYLLLQL